MRVKFLEQVRDPEQEKFVCYGTDQLQADGEAGRRKATGDGYCGDAGDGGAGDGDGLSAGGEDGQD